MFDAPRNAEEIALRVSHHARGRVAAVRPALEIIEVGCIALRVDFEYVCVVRFPVGGGAVQVPGRVPNQSSIRRRAIRPCPDARSGCYSI